MKKYGRDSNNEIHELGMWDNEALCGAETTSVMWEDSYRDLVTNYGCRTCVACGVAKARINE